MYAKLFIIRPFVTLMPIKRDFHSSLSSLYQQCINRIIDLTESGIWYLKNKQTRIYRDSSISKCKLFRASVALEQCRESQVAKWPLLARARDIGICRRFVVEEMHRENVLLAADLLSR